MEVRPLDPAAPDFDEQVADVAELLGRAYATGAGGYAASAFEARVRRALAIQDGGFLAAELDGRLAGAGGFVAYPSGGFGWVGLVGTEPTAERRGVGVAVTKAIVGRLQALGCAVVLDASDAGAPLYERLGFASFGTTRIYEGRPLAKAPPPLDLLAPADLDELVAYDAPRFGAERPVLLGHLLRSFPGRALVVRAATGRIRGYAIAQRANLGPVVADDEVALEALLDAARHVTWPGAIRIDVPWESGHVATLERLGFRAGSRTCVNMRLGIGDLPGDRALLAGQTSLGEG